MWSVSKATKGWWQHQLLRETRGVGVELSARACVQTLVLKGKEDGKENRKSKGMI